MEVPANPSRQDLPKERQWFRRKKLVIIVVVVVVVLAALLAYLIFKPEKKEELSNNPIIAGYEKQLPSLEKKVDDNPKDAQSVQDYAVALYATGDLQASKEQYEALVKLLPKDATARNNLGNVYRDLKEYDKAVEAYQKAIELDSKNVNAYTNLANLYIYTLDKKDLGIKTYQDALKALPDNLELKILLGIAYEQNDDKSNAREQFEAVLASDSDNAAAAAGLKRVQE